MPDHLSILCHLNYHFIYWFAFLPVQVLLCINKCSPFVDQLSKEMTEMMQAPPNETDPEWLKQFKDGKTRMEEALAEKFVEKLNGYYKQAGESTRCLT